MAPKANTPKPPSEPTTFTDGQPLPKLLIFDLDYTLWPLWIDTHATPPLRLSTSPKHSPGTTLLDAGSTPIAFYPHVPALLSLCRRKNILVAAASRTYAPDLARRALTLLQIEGRPAMEYFDALEIWPGDKVGHVDGIRGALGVGCEEMVFFDDESRNGNVERERGVCFWLVRDGVTVGEVDKGIRKWRGRRRQV